MTAKKLQELTARTEAIAFADVQRFNGKNGDFSCLVPRDLHKTFPDETELVKHILIELGRLFPEVLRAWRNNRGNFKTEGGGFIKCGINGQADISGIVAGGRRLEIECKQPGQKQNADQIAFMNMIRRFNGIYVVAYCLADVVQALAWS